MTRAFDGGILIANRGEIALRVMRTARRLGYRTIAVSSGADRDAPHALAADAAVHITSYLDVDAVIDAARQSGAEAIHPGYGFLSERPEFAARCEREGLVFIGPSAAAMRALGDKAQAKRLLEGRVPFLPGYHDADQTDAAFIDAATRLGFPLMVKAAAGGGGRGMRLVREPGDLLAALASARAEAAGAFGDGTLMLERVLIAPRHVEVQIVGDDFGNVVHLGERDCSLQRRFQKVIEEAPSPAIDDALRARLGDAAVTVAQAAGYIGAATIEFLLDAGGAFFFLEANARLQVEHTVTEAVARVDLVEWQIRVARGEPLPLRQDEIRLSGHAIEARLCAEDPARAFLPQSGMLLAWEPPRGVRVDHALVPGIAVTPAYDSMIAKLVTNGLTREDARRALIRALADTVALGVATNAAFLIACLRSPTFIAGQVTTAFAPADADAHPGSPVIAVAAALRYDACAGRSGFGAWVDWSAAPRPPSSLTLSAANDGAALTAGIEPLGPHAYAVTAGGTPHIVTLRPPVANTARRNVEVDGIERTVAYADDGDRIFLLDAGRHHALRDRSAVPAAAQDPASGDGSLRAPTSGRVLDVRVAAGDHVPAGAVAVIVEAMKMEHAIALPHAGRIAAVTIKPGDQVALGDVLVAYAPV